MVIGFTIIAKNLKFPKYPATGEWISDLQCIHVKGYYSAIKSDKHIIHSNNMANALY